MTNLGPLLKARSAARMQQVMHDQATARAMSDLASALREFAQLKLQLPPEPTPGRPPVEASTPSEEPTSPVYPRGPSGPHKHRAARLQDLMRAHDHLTVEGLSNLSRVDGKTIRRLLDGVPVKREDVIARIAAAFGVDVRSIPEN